MDQLRTTSQEEEGTYVLRYVSSKYGTVLTALGTPQRPTNTVRRGRVNAFPDALPYG